MKKLMLIGRVAAGKTTLTQALRGEEIKYYKTQYVYYHDTVIDTPGEYTERRETSGALALYAYEADIVGLVLSANEPYSIFSPCLTSMVNREVIGIISGIDKPDANVERVTRWLKLAGCKKIFPVCAITGQGLRELIEYLETDEERARRLAREEAEKKKAEKKTAVKKSVRARKPTDKKKTQPKKTAEERKTAAKKTVKKEKKDE
ncbi:MAG: EutP/PduV family microcompartment system protein [Clostridia bacterium]|nr:EutP/PduV family microcompartment system protein [Clostridia bacterium]MBP3422834.1 EutP/PduV family microcompartment system protein [Clostridia bacterium]